MSVPIGVPGKDAIYSLGGFVYQIYQAAIAWTDLDEDDLLFLEVAEDFAIVAKDALEAVQVKNKPNDTISLTGVLPSIDDFITLLSKNPEKRVSFRYLTTATITKEQRKIDRVGEKPMLETWRALAKIGDLKEFRKILHLSEKLSEESRNVLKAMDDREFRDKVLRRVHFDCGAPRLESIKRELDNKILKRLKKLRGDATQVEGCSAGICFELMQISIKKESYERVVDHLGLEIHLEKATRTSVNSNDLESLLEKFNELNPVSKIDLDTRVSEPRPLNEVPLPKVWAERIGEIDGIIGKLATSGICWVCGIAGIGKSFAARIAARKAGGRWSTVNLRGLTSDQVSSILEKAGDSISKDLDGLLIEDLDLRQPHVLESFLFLFRSVQRVDVMVVCTSANPAPSNLKFELDCPNITHKVKEFTVQDIQNILKKEEVLDERWSKYIYSISGNGHPQLAMAAIQNMILKDWNQEELTSLNSLIHGNSAIEEVRRNTRLRLHEELPKPRRQLLERLSIKLSGNFTRSFALDLANAVPEIPGGGFILDELIGTWIDQLEADRYHLSPLLSDLAAKTIRNEEKITFQNVMAKSLTRSAVLDVRELNDILWAAWCSKNSEIIVRISTLIISSDDVTIQNIEPHFSLLSTFQTDSAAFPFDSIASHQLRGAQLVLLNLKRGLKHVNKELERFKIESSNNESSGRKSFDFLVYFKLLMQTSNSSVPIFTDIITQLDRILSDPNEAVYEFTRKNPDLNLLGFLFLNQIRLLTKIDELTEIFEYLDECDSVLREKLLTPIPKREFDIGMILIGAWSRELESETIEVRHRESFAKLSRLAEKWGDGDLAISCRIFQARVADELENNAQLALEIVDGGLSTYPKSLRLRRAKSQVFFRASRYADSLKIAIPLMEENHFENFERASLGRESGISAERLRDFKSASRYYRYGSDAAGKSVDSEIKNAMRVGLLADSALASWHDGAQETCLKGLADVLTSLKEFSPEDSLRSAHCHALTFHLLYWLKLDVTAAQHAETVVYPGCVSNPSPSPLIAERKKPPLGMAWYMLAALENRLALNFGVTKNLKSHLPQGEILEGELVLTPAKMHHAFVKLNVTLFLTALSENISQDLLLTRSQTSYDVLCVNYGTHPTSSFEQQKKRLNITEKTTLFFCSMCVMRGQEQLISQVTYYLDSENSDLFFRKAFTIRLQSHVDGLADINANFAQTIFLISSARVISLIQIYDFVCTTIRLSTLLGYERICIPAALHWLEKNIENQFLTDQNTGTDSENLYRLLEKIVPQLLLDAHTQLSLQTDLIEMFREIKT